MKIIKSATLIVCLLSASLTGFTQKTTPKKPAQETLILMETNMGNIKMKLYNETPQHRDNFIKLVEKHFYDSLLFHRVIKEFMIQAGDPESKKPSSPDVMLGNGDVGYTIPAEFNPVFFHKKGVLSAARQSDEVNPLKASSGCQFYIVHGKTFSVAELEMLEKRINDQKKNTVFNQMLMLPENAAIKDSLMVYQQTQNQQKFQELISATLLPKVEAEIAKAPFKFSEEQKKIYSTIGGAPHLDGGYTVFGEVTEGLDIVDKIANVEKNQFDRPLQDVRITKMTIVKK